jgi:hypothetical protein
MPGLEPGIRALPSLITTQTATLDARVDPRIKSGDVHEDPAAPPSRPRFRDRKMIVFLDY